MEYLRQVHDLHEKWISSLQQNVPVIIVDANQDVDEVPDIYSRHEEEIFSNLRSSKKSHPPAKSLQPKSPRKVLGDISTTNRVIGSA